MHDQPTSGGNRPHVRAEGYTTMNTLRALERLAAGPVSVPELGTALGVDVRSARRLLRRLRTEGYVVQDVGHRRRYRATLRLVAVGAVLLRRAALPRLAAPVLAGLASGHGATARLWIAGDDRPVCVLTAAGEATEATSAAIVVAPQPCARGGAPVVAVLDPRRGERRSCAYRREDGGAVAAAAVLDRGAVVGALALDGSLDAGAAARVSLAAVALEAALSADGHG